MARTVKYASTRGEIWRWYWRAWRNGLWTTHAIVFCAVSSTIVLTVWNEDAPLEMKVLWAVMAGFASVAWMPFFPMIKFKPQTRTLVVDERGISTVIGSKSGVYTWDQIKSVAEEDGAIVIVDNKKCAFIIPARAFENEIGRLDFLAYVQSVFNTPRTSAG